MHHVRHTRLGRAVTINEEIKRVIAVSFRVNLMALNAILLARRAGGSAMGFRVLSTELREFIRDLQQTMNRLRDLTNESVRFVSEDTRQARIEALWQRTSTMLPSDSPVRSSLEPVLRTCGDRAAKRRTRLTTITRTLSGTVADAARLGDFGAILARTAKIEAVYGGGFAPSLHQVATEFDGTIREILASMDVLGKLQREGTAS